jgi:hypothetical protein
VNEIDLTKNEESQLEYESLGEKIELIIERLPPLEVTLVEIMDIVGADSLTLLTIFLSLVFLVPVSIPGVSTVFGTGICSLASPDSYHANSGFRNESVIERSLLKNCAWCSTGPWSGSAGWRRSAALID